LVVVVYDGGPELEELYDERTLAALERAAGEPAAEPWRPDARRPRFAPAWLTGTALALQQVFDPTPDEEPVVELRPDVVDRGDRWVTFVYVPGAPHASRLVIRPWLATPA
jgi:hypothetical protein